jgi:hypothetical protein
LEFLRSHQEIANENIMWHTHEIDIPIKARERQRQRLSHQSFFREQTQFSKVKLSGRLFCRASFWAYLSCAAF